MTKNILTLLLCLLAGAWAQQSPRYFELRLPGVSATSFAQEESLIEVPDRPLERLEIVILQARERNIMPGRYRVWLNGKGIGNVLDEFAVTDGILLRMSSENLRMRPDELFDPWENTVEIAAQDRRGRQYYASWIIRKRSSGRNPYFTYTGLISPTDPDGIPPDLLIESPLSPPVMRRGEESSTVTLRGTLSAASPGATLSVNGEPLVESSPQATARFETEIPIDRNATELVLEALDRRGHRRRAVIPVVIQGAAKPVFQFPGNKYALIIGISDYGSQQSSPPTLPGAAIDAPQLAELLETNGGFPKENIRLLLDKQASLPQIRTGFSDFAAQAGPDDLLVVYVAAHGLHDPRPGRSDRLYLAPYGTLLSEIDATAMRFSDLEMSVSRSIRSNHAFLIFDVGHELGDEWRLPGRSMVNNHLLNLFSEQDGRSVIVSGSADELSRERQGEGRAIGLFNHWLMAGLDGGGDLDDDQAVTASELFNYVTARVIESSAGLQNPRYRLASSVADAPIGTLALPDLPQEPVPDP
jgi:caspase domain-containing protein